jgi:hypothetical protein
MKAFGGRLYRPDVAPADAPVNAVEVAVEVAEPVAAQAVVPQQPSTPTPPADGAFPRLAISNPLFEAAPAKRK